MNNYSELTINDLVNFVMTHQKSFPNGMNTKITSGDFEGNTYHKKYELMRDGINVCLGFELHEF